MKQGSPLNDIRALLINIQSYKDADKLFWVGEFVSYVIENSLGGLYGVVVPAGNVA